ncbi:ABC-2 type transport system ATP-binding protein [Spinactinospora alkalitolerans]|uniref:ABC-2 type transport system ATP-binding protein n=1 Tax=Spinactinospora alkalitolerans TaxID=687207 RepID=A0A852U0K0_9ACTN|nr:ABC transporter ATP-binding protein [Spinactinospora alkalitolerans]NYE49728.1 ABC-2 type transport system ATP-binding protein [Spinactinospora alkalitolerans]
MTQFAVRAQGLVKRFGSSTADSAHTAVAGIDLEVPAGSFFGLVGPNGAGKTTTLSMITGLLRPSAGRVEILGHDVWSDPAAAKARMGALPEGVRMFDRLSGRELLRFTGRLHGLPADVVAARADELLDVLDLTGAANHLVVDYSTGMRKKVGLASALLHNPAVLFLDEPFEGVDPVSAGTIRRVLERYTRSGSTVIFSSHVMELVEQLCDRVAILNRGRVVAAGEVGSIRGGRSLHEAFLAIVGVRAQGEDGGLAWLGTSSG